MDGCKRRMGQGVWFISAMPEDTMAPEYRERPTRSHLTNAERGNPVAVLTRYADRKEGRYPQRAQDVPRSEGQWPKGTGKLGARLSDNLLDRAMPTPKGC